MNKKQIDENIIREIEIRIARKTSVLVGVIVISTFLYFAMTWFGDVSVAGETTMGWIGYTFSWVSLGFLMVIDFLGILYVIGGTGRDGME